MLLGREEEGAVHQRVAVEHGHEAAAEQAGGAVQLVRGQRRQDEAARLVVAVVALVLHLDLVRVELEPGQHVEGAEIEPPSEDAIAARAVSVGEELGLVEAPPAEHRAAEGRAQGAAGGAGALLQAAGAADGGRRRGARRAGGQGAGAAADVEAGVVVGVALVVVAAAGEREHGPRVLVAPLLLLAAAAA